MTGAASPGSLAAEERSPRPCLPPEIVVLPIVVGITAPRFQRIRPLAGLLMLPYLAWLLFATALAFALSRRNPGLL